MAEVTTREQRLEDLTKDLAQMRKEWEAAGSPLLIRTASLDMRPHPLVKMIRECEEMIERMSRPVEAARGGRPKGASSAPDRVPSSSAPPKRTQLKAVGE